MRARRLDLELISQKKTFYIMDFANPADQSAKMNDNLDTNRSPNPDLGE